MKNFKFIYGTSVCLLIVGANLLYFSRARHPDRAIHLPSPTPVVDPIAAALLESNHRYQFKDGLVRRGFSTIHELKPETASKVATSLRGAAVRSGLPVNYLAAFVSRESTGDPRAEFRNPSSWYPAQGEREQFAAADHGLVQISGRNLIRLFPDTPLEDLKRKAEEIEFSTRYLSDQISDDLKWASTLSVETHAEVNRQLVERIRSPYWLAALAYNRGRPGALAALVNPSACIYADSIIQEWARLDVKFGTAPSDTSHAPTFPALESVEAWVLAMGEIRPRVEALQSLLNASDPLQSPLRVDGNFGPGTRAALLRFQASQGLDPKGATDEKTWKALAGLGVRSGPGEPQILMIGDTGPKVAALQKALNLSVAPTPLLKADGNFGPETRDALRQFQCASKLVDTGVVDRQTWQRLNLKFEAK